MTAIYNPTHGLDSVQRVADQRILLDFIGKRTAIDVDTAGSSYNNVDKVLYSTLRRSKACSTSGVKYVYT